MAQNIKNILTHSLFLPTLMLAGCSKTTGNLDMHPITAVPRALDNEQQQREFDKIGNIAEAIDQEHSEPKQGKYEEIEPSNIVHNRGYIQTHAPASSSLVARSIAQCGRDILSQYETSTIVKYAEDTVLQFAQANLPITDSQSEIGPWNIIARTAQNAVTPHMSYFAEIAAAKFANVVDGVKYYIGLEPDNIKNKDQYKIPNDEDDEGFVYITETVCITETNKDEMPNDEKN